MRLSLTERPLVAALDLLLILAIGNHCWRAQAAPLGQTHSDESNLAGSAPAKPPSWLLTLHVEAHGAFLAFERLLLG